MTKYGFDYFVKRAETLEEMAGRPSPWAGKGEGSGDTVVDAFRTVNTLMARGGKLNVPDLKTGETTEENVPGLGSNRSTNRALRYLIYMMSKMDVSDEGTGDDDIGEDEAKSEIVAQAAQILGVPKEGWSRIKDDKGNIMFKDPDKLYRAAIQKGIDTFKDYIMSPEFKQKTSDPNNIISYVKGNRLPTAASHAKSVKRGAAHGGMSQEDMDRLETFIKGPLEKLHRAQFYKKRRRFGNNSEYGPMKGEETPEVGAVSNEFTDNIYVITNALEELINRSSYVKQLVNAEQAKGGKRSFDTIVDEVIEDNQMLGLSPDDIETLYNANTGDLQALYKYYSSLSDVGVDMDDFYAKIQKFRAKSPEPVQKVLDLWMAEIKALEDTAAEAGLDYGEENEFGTSPDYAGYDESLVEQYFPSEQDRANFKEWNAYRIRNMEARLAKVTDDIEAAKWGDVDISKSDLDAGMNAFYAKRPHLAPKKKGEVPTKKPTMKQKEEEAKFDADSWTPQDYDMPEEDEETPSVMGYMTEQISKDRFKSKGEFKDRGFKKMSYHDWIVKYQ